MAEGGGGSARCTASIVISFIETRGKSVALNFPAPPMLVVATEKKTLIYAVSYHQEERMDSGYSAQL